MTDQQQPYYALRTRRPADGSSLSSADSTVRSLTSPPDLAGMTVSRYSSSAQYGSGAAGASTPSATHDVSRVSYHVKHLDSFAQTLQDVRCDSSPLGVVEPVLICLCRSPPVGRFQIAADPRSDIRKCRHSYCTGGRMTYSFYPSWKTSKNASEKTMVSRPMSFQSPPRTLT